MTKLMNLSDLIRLGSTLVSRQVQRHYFTREQQGEIVGACSIGAALLALGKPASTWGEDWYAHTERRVYALGGPLESESNLAIRLNDQMGLPFNTIADILDFHFHADENPHITLEHADRAPAEEKTEEQVVQV